MSLVLHNALGFPTDHSLFQSANEIRGRNVQWTLGALLYRTRFMPLRCVLYLLISDVIREFFCIQGNTTGISTVFTGVMVRDYSSVTPSFHIRTGNGVPSDII